MHYILNKKYNVIVDTENPDLVFYSNLFTPDNQIDDCTGVNCSMVENYPNAKKIFMSGEHVPDYAHWLKSPSHYTIGVPCSVNNEHTLQVQAHSMCQAWFLWHSCKLFSGPDWITAPRKYEEIKPFKQHFCSIVQNAEIPYRRQLFDKLHSYEFVRAVGHFESTVPDYRLYHDEILDYTNKHNFMKECIFSIQTQSTCYDRLTHEKMIQAFAANTIPIFWGNNKILEDGWNPEAFINCHNFDTVDEVVEHVKEIHADENKIKQMLEEPIFMDNKPPVDFDEDYLLSFLTSVIDA
jgi:hypothetical protein